jgi:hypothetical protein
VTGTTTPAWTGPDGEPTLADVQREFPGWQCWRAISGLCHARPATAAPGEPAPVTGEDPRDLRDQIIRRKAQMDEAAWRAAHTSGPST